MKNKRKRYLAGIIATVIIILFLTGFISHIVRENTPIIVKKNVKVVTNETLYNNSPFLADTDVLMYTEEQGYKVGDVLVAGITDISPNGFIRKITEIDYSDGSYTYYTEPATLLDVFEKAYIVKQFQFTDGELLEVNNSEINNATGISKKYNTSPDYTIKTLEYIDKPNISNISTENLFIEIDEKMTLIDNVEVNINAEVDLWLEIQIDIEDNNIVFATTANHATFGNIHISKEDEVDFFNRVLLPHLLKEFKMPNVQFYISNIPVVITNELKLYVDGELKIGGDLNTDVSLDSSRRVGFEYDSKAGGIREINEKDYLSDGIKWNTSIGAYGKSKLLLDLHLITKMYGSTGADLSIGISGEVNGEILAETDETGVIETYGELDMKISPETSGKIIVDFPVIDYRLAEATLFEETLSPLWQYTWENKAEFVLDCRDERFLIYDNDGLRIYALIDKENPIDVSLYGINYSGKEYACGIGFVRYNNKFATGNLWNNISKDDKFFCIISPNTWMEYDQPTQETNLTFNFAIYEIDNNALSYSNNSGNRHEFTLEQINGQILTKENIVDKYSNGSIINEKIAPYITTSHIILPVEETKTLKQLSQGGKSHPVFILLSFFCRNQHILY